MRKPTFISLRVFNHLLSVVAAALALYIIFFPFSPGVTWWVTHSAPLPIHHKTVSVPPVADDEKSDRPQVNTLIVPRLDMDQEIFDGPNIATLRKGLWHRPNTSSPPKAGNTVIVGHRFTYAGSGIFYHLDKIEVGDPIVIYWQGTRYDYTVTVKKVVDPNDPTVEAASSDPILTLYTCTPLWSAHDRLVIQAKLEGKTI